MPQPLFEPLDETGMDMYELTRQLDIVKSKVFMGNTAAFLGSLMASMEFHWTRSIPTAATNGVILLWNPDWFLSLKPLTRATVFVHELWHPARMHMVRLGTRCPDYWNFACDIRINNDLEDQGYSFDGVEDCWKDQQYAGWVEEDIYEAIKQNGPKPQNGTWGKGEDGEGGDMLPSDDATKAKALNNIVRAVHASKLAGQAGTIPGEIEEMISKFLKPVVNWEHELQKWMSDLSEEDFTWQIRSRRSQDVYLPSEYIDEGRLEHLMFFQDTSGSISTQDTLRFNSELKYVWDRFQPQKMTIVEFDTVIQMIYVIEEGDIFDEIKIQGRGGTCLKCVHAMITKERPTAAIIFSDMYVEPMAPLKEKIPLLWVRVGGGGHIPAIGKTIDIEA